MGASLSHVNQPSKNEDNKVKTHINHKNIPIIRTDYVFVKRNPTIPISIPTSSTTLFSSTSVHPMLKIAEEIDVGFGYKDDSCDVNVDNANETVIKKKTISKTLQNRKHRKKRKSRRKQ